MIAPIKVFYSIVRGGQPLFGSFGNAVSRLGIDRPVINGEIFWKVVPGYVDDDFEMQEHINFPTLQDRYRIITTGRRDYQLTDSDSRATVNLKVKRWPKVKVAKAKTFEEIKREWARWHKYVQ